MTAADRSRKTDELIGLSEEIRASLLTEVEKLELFVVALQGALAGRGAEGFDDAGDQ